MPTSLSVRFNIKHKNFKLTAWFLLSPLFFFAQSLTGLWTGVLTNDSNSVRKDQSFEIALTEYRGKVYGYSRSEFIVNDTLYYIVKRVKGSIDGDVCEVKDDDIISYNFPTRLDKGVKVISTFYRNKKDSVWYLAGSWKTTQTKTYYSVTGKIDMKEEKDLSASKIFPHLEELNLANDVAFYKDSKKEKESFIVKNLVPENKKTETTIKTSQNSAFKTVSSISTKEESKPAEVKSLSTESFEETVLNIESKKPESIIPIAKTIAVNKTEPIKTASVPRQYLSKNNESKEKDVASVTQKNKAVTNIELKPAPEKQTELVNKEEIKTNQNTLNKDLAKINEPEKKEIISQVNKKDVPTAKAEQTLVNKTPVATSNKPDVKNIAKTTNTIALIPVKQTDTEIKKSEKDIVTGNNILNTSVNTVIEKREPVIIIADTWNKNEIADMGTAATFVKERKSELTQVVNFKSDSLELAIYDNGEIDGDTVSLLLNGEIILAKQCLKASAIKKTIYITSGADAEFTMILYAENLGKYPPNTGLLVVHDGDDVYNIRFSADLQKNAGVTFRRKN